MAILPQSHTPAPSPDEARHRAGWDDDKLLAECQIRHTRSRGPGGQHRNKVQTGVEIRHTLTGLVGTASERREQSRNHVMALFRLRVTLAVELRCPVDPLSEPSELWRSRVKARPVAASPKTVPRDVTRELGSLLAHQPSPQHATGIVKVNVDHHDYPALLAQAMDIVQVCSYQTTPAATWLGVSPSQLIKFLATEPRALAKVNQQRQLRNLRLLQT
jgi:hypothetical protein